MTPLPKKKHTRSRSNIRRGKKALTVKTLFARYTKAKGIEKKLASQAK